MRGTYRDADGKLLPAMEFDNALEYAKNNIIPNIQFTFRPPPPDPQAVVLQTGGQFTVDPQDLAKIKLLTVGDRKYKRIYNSIKRKLENAGATSQQALQVMQNAGIQ